MPKPQKSKKGMSELERLREENEYLKAENGFYIDGFEKSGEKVTLICGNYEKIIGSILNGTE